MRLEHRVIKIIVHITAWLLLITFSFLVEKSFPFDTSIQFTLLRIALHALVFYITYLFLMPLLYKKKVWQFVAISLFLLFGTTFLKQSIMRNYRESRLEYRMPDDSMFDSPENPDFAFKGEKFGPPFKGGWGRKSHFFLDVTSLFLFYAMAFSFRFIKKWQDDEEFKTLLEKEKVKTELQYLKQQMNPHFLFNSLNSIYSLALTKSEQTTDSILKLSSILRYVLYRSEDTLVNLSEEVITVKNYVDLQKLRLTEHVDLSLDIQGSSEGFKVAPFLLIPVIENAFKYGSDNVNPSFINILLTIENDLLLLSVTNKIVQEYNPENKDSGIGLKNIKRRLELIYSDGYTFETQKTNGTFTVVLELKLNK